MCAKNMLKVKAISSRVAIKSSLNSGNCGMQQFATHADWCADAGCAKITKESTVLSVW